MIKFLKENAVFFTSSILLIGLFTVTSEIKKNSSENQINSDQKTPIYAHDATDKTEPKPTPNTITLPLGKETPKKSNPTPVPSINPKIQQDYYDDEGDD